MRLIVAFLLLVTAACNTGRETASTPTAVVQGARSAMPETLVGRWCGRWDNEDQTAFVITISDMGSGTVQVRNQAGEFDQVFTATTDYQTAQVRGEASTVDMNLEEEGLNLEQNRDDESVYSAVAWPCDDPS